MIEEIIDKKQSRYQALISFYGIKKSSLLQAAMCHGDETITEYINHLVQMDVENLKSQNKNID